MSSPIIAITGGSLSGNKGAASMTQAVADGVRKHIPDAVVRVFSPYPDSDRQIATSVEIVDFSPRAMLGAVAPALLCLVTRRRWKPTRGTSGSLSQAHVAADVSGISFMDGRGLLTLGYNVLLVLLPWAFGVPVVKVAQALGPFHQPVNRVAARSVLPLSRWIGLRGSSTAAHAAGLGLVNAEPSADVAFLLEPSDSDEAEAENLILKGRTPTLVVPSVVVERACAAEGIDYVGLLVEMIIGLEKAGHDVVILAHSAREGAPAGRTNDLPLCRELAARAGVECVDQEVHAGALRAAIRSARLLVTSRFHAMVSGLATGTPTFVVGWSHKYREVLSEFGLEDRAMDFRGLDGRNLLEAVQLLDGEADTVRDQISAAIDPVMKQAELNISRIVEAVGTGKR